MPSYINMGPTPTHITAEATTVDCHKQVRTWRLLRAIMELLIPTCNCTFVHETDHNQLPTTINNPKPPPFSSASFLTGTIFGYKKGKVKFCIQSNSTSTNPILLLELAVPTTILAREMRNGLLRIALECSLGVGPTNGKTEELLEMPVWKMYCNGRRVGFAVRRKPCKADMEVLKRMKNVVVGAGIVSGKEIGCEEDDIMYLRGNFERVCGSSDAQSFHLIDPDGNINQDLSIFFIRSR
ncbi:protein MIZU-KUSSEI 1-like [Amaranthus tricolor]|uniref:protein MIZU-KUSSEI 1-like n=1 Tax=Amaranthus tricolor TaxID=29722 RepID=UPI00258CF776|nr:protein MIZU-KUSSEI 1-like [Amaranthus tricolor]